MGAAEMYVAVPEDRDPQPPSRASHGRWQGKEIHLPAGMEAGPLWRAPGGQPEQHEVSGGSRYSVCRRDAALDTDIQNPACTKPLTRQEDPWHSVLWSDKPTNERSSLA